MGAWVTWPEHAKGEFKQARRTKSRPEGPPARSRGPRLLVLYIYKLLALHCQTICETSRLSENDTKNVTTKNLKQCNIFSGSHLFGSILSWKCVCRNYISTIFVTFFSGITSPNSGRTSPNVK